MHPYIANGSKNVFARKSHRTSQHGTKNMKTLNNTNLSMTREKNGGELRCLYFDKMHAS